MYKDVMSIVKMILFSPEKLKLRNVSSAWLLSLIYEGSDLTMGVMLVKAGAPNDCRAAFVGCFDDEVISVFEIYEGSPFFFGEVRDFGVAIRF